MAPGRLGRLGCGACKCVSPNDPSLFRIRIKASYALGAFGRQDGDPRLMSALLVSGEDARTDWSLVYRADVYQQEPVPLDEACPAWLARLSRPPSVSGLAASLATA